MEKIQVIAKELWSKDRRIPLGGTGGMIERIDALGATTYKKKDGTDDLWEPSTVKKWLLPICPNPPREGAPRGPRKK